SCVGDAEDAARARPILDNDGLVQNIAELLRNRASDKLDDASRRVRQDQMNRPQRIVLGCSGRRIQCERQRCKQQNAYPAQSCVMCASVITFFHFTYSDRVKAALSARLVPPGVSPNLAKAALSSSACSALAMPLLSLASTSGGVLAAV